MLLDLKIQNPHIKHSNCILIIPTTMPLQNENLAPTKIVEVRSYTIKEGKKYYVVRLNNYLHKEISEKELKRLSPVLYYKEMQLQKEE